MTQTTGTHSTGYFELGYDTGEDQVAKMGHALGIPDATVLPEVSSLPLGVADVRPIDMADVYATFANQGETATAHLQVSIDNQVASEQDIQLTQGQNHVTISPTVNGEGFHPIGVRVSAARDTDASNNVGFSFVAVKPKP